jgi:hypothetical protein
MLSHFQSLFSDLALSDTHANTHFGENFLLLLASALLRFDFYSFLPVFCPLNWSVLSFAFSDTHANEHFGEILLSVLFRVFRFVFLVILLLNTNRDGGRFLD